LFGFPAALLPAAAIAPRHPPRKRSFANKPLMA